MNENEARSVVDGLLSQFGQLSWESSPGPGQRTAGPSALFRYGNSQYKVVLEYASNGSPKSINEFAGRMGEPLNNKELTILVAPFISDRGRSICMKRGIAFVDLSGNAYIRTADLLIDRWGRENRFKAVRKQVSMFSTKSAWVIRNMLSSPEKGWTTKELAEASKVSLAQVFKVTEALEGEDYMTKARGDLRLIDAPALLDAWASAYRYDAGGVTGYYSSFKEREEVFDRLRQCPKCDYALTLGAAASLVAPAVRSTDVYVYSKGIDALKDALQLVPVEFGGNIYVIGPRDEAVLRGTRTIEGLKVVSDLQLYLDLYNYPQRGREQAEEVRRQALRF